MLNLSWCSPAILYAICGVGSISYSLFRQFKNPCDPFICTEAQKKDIRKYSICHIVYHVLWTILWLWIILKLCSSGHTGWAWVLALSAVMIQVLSAIILVGLMNVMQRLPPDQRKKLQKVFQQKMQQVQQPQQQQQQQFFETFQQPMNPPSQVIPSPQMYSPPQQQMATSLASLQNMNSPMPMSY